MNRHGDSNNRSAEDWTTRGCSKHRRQPAGLEQGQVDQHCIHFQLSLRRFWRRTFVDAVKFADNRQGMNLRTVSTFF